MKWIIAALIVGGILYILISAEMTYIRADKEKNRHKLDE